MQAANVPILLRRALAALTCGLGAASGRVYVPDLSIPVIAFEAPDRLSPLIALLKAHDLSKHWWFFHVVSGHILKPKHSRRGGVSGPSSYFEVDLYQCKPSTPMLIIEYSNADN